jgi:hypothetical protein
MTKKEKLVRLDELVLNRQIQLLETNNTAELSDLTPTINYLRNNAVVADKEKSTVEKDTAKRLAEAKARRKNNESK